MLEYKKINTSINMLFFDCIKYCNKLDYFIATKWNALSEKD